MPIAPTVDDVELFAGPGGWARGVAALGVHSLGVEWNRAACDTAEAAGYRRLCADVALLDPRAVTRGARVRRTIGSPPCQGFSWAGSGRGRADSELLLAAIAERFVDDPVGTIAELDARMTDDRSALVLEPLRWALALSPEVIAWEQVPAVLPIWRACAEVLERFGYSTAVGVVSAEQYGVPQTRRRAILVARDAATTAALGPAALPRPTHSRYYPTDPRRLDPGVLPWVSLGEALGVEAPAAIRSNYGTGGDPAARGMREWWQPAATVTSKINRNRWVGRPGVDRGVDMAEAALLQSFPADYPWRGKLTEQQQQVGDAVPPLLARAIVAAACGLDLPVDVELAAA